MHKAAHNFIAESLEGPYPRVIEIGSRDINGSIRSLFKGSEYVGLDLHEGPAVDWVGDACDYEPEAPVSAVVCCEVLEHAPEWKRIVTTAASWLEDGGYLFITCAGPGRKPHSAIDGKRRLHPGEHYANVPAAELADVLRDAGLTVSLCREAGEDTQAVAIR